MGGFTLVEVVLAIGIVAVAVLGAAGLAAPLALGRARAREGEEALVAVEAVLAELRRMEFAEVTSRLVRPDEFATPAAGGADDARLFRMTRDGGCVAAAEDPGWSHHPSGPFFEATLVRDERLSPEAGDATAPCLVFHLVVRWPIETPTRSAGPRKQLAVLGSVRR